MQDDPEEMLTIPQEVLERARALRERPVYVNLIFENDSNGNYTHDALLYQDILEYLFEQNDNSSDRNGFRFNDIAGWLVMKKNREFLSYYSDNNSRTPKQHRINARRRRIQRHIDDLEKMYLLRNTGSVKARRNYESTPLYTYSTHGHIIAWIIKRNTTDILYDKNEMKKLVPAKKQELTKLRNMAEENIYNIITQHEFPKDKPDSINTSRLYGEHPSKDFVAHRFFKMAKENDIFNIIIDAIRDLLQSNTKSMYDIFDRIIYELTIYRKEQKVWNTFITTLNGLDATTRKIILFYEKMNIERRIFEESDKISREWEELWLQNINDCYKLVLIGSCKNCIKTYPVLVDYYKYKEEVNLLDKSGGEPIPFEYGIPVLYGNCNKCNTNGSLLISTWGKFTRD